MRNNDLRNNDKTKTEKTEFDKINLRYGHIHYRIIVAVVEIIRDHGGHVSWPEVAAKTGITLRTIQTHFKSTDPRTALRDEILKGLIICGSCGGKYRRSYTNAKKSDKAIWICNRFHKYGKAVCQSQQIPEAILIEKTEEVLGETDLTAEMIALRISHILVPEHNHLIYELKDGSIISLPWNHLSRSHSWTPEMRQAARQKALEHAAERRKNEHGTRN